MILASRIEPTTSQSREQQKGVQSIVVLPNANKALILCNGTLTFHSLPELSPAPNAPGPVKNCLWIGGNDLNANGDENGAVANDTAMMALRSKMRVLTIGERIIPKQLDFPGCLGAVRRGRYACVADPRSYALVDLETSQKIPLFPISSLDETAVTASERQNQASFTLSEPRSPPSGRQRSDGGHADRGHGRNTSLGSFVSGLTNRQIDQRPRTQNRSGLNSPQTGSGAVSPNRPAPDVGDPSARALSPDRPHPPLPAEPSPERTAAAAATQIPGPHTFLQPHILSPLPGEFLLFTGTSNVEPGVGIFVNMDGDVVRGTLELRQYPSTVALDGGMATSSSQHQTTDPHLAGYLLAAFAKKDVDGQRGIEIQRWDVNGAPRAFLELPKSTHPIQSKDIPTVGVSTPKTGGSLKFREIGNALKSKRFRLHVNLKEARNPEDKESSESDKIMNAQEDEFANQLGQGQAHVLAWHDNHVSWVARNPILLQVEGSIAQVLEDCKDSRLDQARLIRIMKSLRGHDAQSETEFLSLEYVKQKISVILFADLAVNRDDVNPQLNEQLLMEAGADPRLILAMVPFLRRDIFEGPSGIWSHAGLIELMEGRLRNVAVSLEPDEVLERPEDFDVLGLVKRYLSAWRQRKGFGSIQDEEHVFATVDAALLHVLLLQDQQSPMGPGSSATIRSELYAIADNPVNCFERAVELLEDYRRLYVLSRLYQSRRMAKKVLDTWRRILDGEPDEGGAFTDGESEMRRYLANRTDRALIEEYGTWLARRNPQLGVQVFSDDAAKVRMAPDQVVKLLREHAPDAVKVYLEHLVFGKKHLQYADKLISYYLDSVLSVLSTSQQALSLLSASYKDYRALTAPKPTYREFITDASVPEQWWSDRLRLLELLGGSHGSGFTYDVPAVLERIEPFEEALVPESIILEGQQGHHVQALRLLVHGLGDYHTAINYCLLGGASLFHPATPGTSSSHSKKNKNSKNYNERNSEAAALVPTHAQQSTLFAALLREFLQISSSAQERQERTADLLCRFGPWFLEDVGSVLRLIPDEWAVGAVAAFLAQALRRTVSERNESLVVKALSGAENLKVAVQLVEKVEGLGPTVVPAVDTPGSGEGYA